MSLLLFAAVANATPLVIYDLESDDGSFVESGETGVWAWGDVGNGPGSGFDGARAWSTGLVSDYLNDTTDYLEIPVPALTGVERPMFSFQHWYDIAPGDAAWVEADTGSGTAWEAVTPLYGYPVGGAFTGTSAGWRTVVVDLTGFGETPRVRLVFATDYETTASGWTIDQVAFHDGDVAAPQLSGLSALADTEDLTGPYTVEVTAEDDTAVAAVTLHWEIDGVEDSAAMLLVGDGLWRGEIPAQGPDTDVAYWVEATDTLNESREPVDGELEFRVYLPAPTNLVGPLGRVLALEAPLSWTAPTTSHEVLGYEILREGESVLEVESTSADVPLLGGVERFTVRALYAEGAGDESDAVEVDGVLPVVHGLSPGDAWPGETVRVRLVGEYLLFVDDEVTLDLGEGITVGEIDVRDVDTLYVDLTVAPGAAVGDRTLTLSSGDVTLTAERAFEVLDSDDQPRLLSVEPDLVRQGETGELVVLHAGELSAVPTVDLGEGLTVESVVVQTGKIVIGYSVATNAALGDRTIEVDDGVRVLDDVTLEVADARTAEQRTCGSPVFPGAGLALAGLALVARRRR